MARRGRRGGGFGWIVGLIVFLGLLWIGYWYAAQYAAGRALARIAAGPVHGRTVGCSGATLGGFPFRLDLHCDRGTYAEANDRIAASLGGLSATAPLYWPGYAESIIDAPLLVNAPGLGLALTTSWTSGTANVTAGLGGLKGAGASFLKLDAENADPTGRLPLKSVTADTASGSIEPAGGGDYTVMGSTQALQVVSATHGNLPVIDGSARVTLVGVGSSLGSDPARTLRDWLRAGGKANIERARLAIGGAILGANGTLSLSKEGRLNGSILLRFNSIDALADLVETLRPGTRDKYSIAFAGLNAMSAPVQTPDGPARQTTLRLTDGLIWLGVIPLPIDPIPPIGL
jgi:hypothetical protein